MKAKKMSYWPYSYLFGEEDTIQTKKALNYIG